MMSPQEIIEELVLSENKLSAMTGNARKLHKDLAIETEEHQKLRIIADKLHTESSVLRLENARLSKDLRSQKSINIALDTDNKHIKETLKGKQSQIDGRQESIRLLLIEKNELSDHYAEEVAIKESYKALFIQKSEDEKALKKQLEKLEAKYKRLKVVSNALIDSAVIPQ